nr:TrbG/VirB9 family P-type conjugative transfer protein [Microvirga tunisiensis]
MPGFLKVAWRPDIVMEVNVREGMLTVMKWPMQEEVVSREISDKKTFESRIGPDKRSILIRSVYSGVDGNMVVFGSSGNVYNVYLRSIPYNSERLPDTTVEVVVGGMSDSYGGTLHSTAPTSAPYTDYRDLYQPAVTEKSAAFKAGSREWADSVSANGRDMEANIDILVPDQSDQIIAPIRAWHDKHFTYLDFGPNASSMNQWPVASLVTDGTETPIGTRTAGPKGSIMIIEAIGDLVLRNGRHLVCLKLRNQPDNRVSPKTLVADTTSRDLPRSGEVVRVAPVSPAPAAPAPVSTQYTKAPAPVAASSAPKKAARPANPTTASAPSDKMDKPKAAEAKPAAKTTTEKPVQKAPQPFVFDASGLSGAIQ